MREQKAKSKKQNDDGVTPEQSAAQSEDSSEASQESGAVTELTGDLQRLQAEFINYKNRVESEKTLLSQFATAQTVKDLLPVIDDLERALAHLPENLKEDKWAQGVQKVYGRLQKQLEKLGVKKIDALGKQFDHNLHEAVQAEGEGDIQIVTEVLQQGYQINNQVIRHAVVKVTNQ